MSFSHVQGFIANCWQVAVKLASVASRWPPRSLPKKSQFLRLCGAPHNRNYAQFRIMRSCVSFERILLFGNGRQLRIIRSQLFQEVEKAISLGTPNWFVWRTGKPIEDLPFHFDICFDVLMRCFRTLMSEPECDDRDINSCLEQMHGRGMPQWMRRHGLSGE